MLVIPDLARMRSLATTAIRTGLWLVAEGLTLVALTLTPALFFWRILSQNKADWATFPLGDFTELHFPYRHWAAEELARGRLPTWNPFVSAGHPSLGDVQFGLLYPIGALFARLYGGELTVLGLEQQVIAHFGVSAVGTYLFARTVGAGRAGSVLAALAFTYAGYMTSFPVQQIIILQTSVWLPWILLGLELGIGRREPLWGLLIAAATMMAALVGHPQTLAYVLGLSTAYGFYRLGQQPSLRGLLAASIGGTLGIALAAPALLPALEHLRLTARTDVGYSFTAHGFRPHELLGLVFPTDLGGRPLYVGIPVLALAGLAVATRRPGSGFWAATAAVATVLSLGGNSFLYPAAYVLMPGLQFFRDHERAALIVTLALAVLAGQGLGVALRSGLGAPLRQIGLAARAAVAIGGVFALFGLFLQYAVLTTQGDQRNQIVAVGDRAFLTALFGILAGALLWAAWRSALRPVLLATALVGVAAIDLFSAGQGLNLAPGGSWQTLLRATPTVQFLRQNVGPLDRVASEGVLPADGNVGALFRIPDLVGNTPLELESYQLFGNKIEEFQRWRMLGVRFIVTKRKIEDPRLPLVHVENDLNTHELRPDLRLPRAWLVHRAIPASGREEELELTRRIKPEEEVVLASSVGPLDGRAPESPVAERSDVAVTAYEPDHFTLRTWSSRDAVLVLGERDYPGWHATIDGHPVPVIRANYLLRAVYLPAGRHEVVFSFEPPGFALGQRIADLALPVALALAAIRIVVPLLLAGGAIAGAILARRSRAPSRRRRYLPGTMEPGAAAGATRGD